MFAVSAVNAYGFAVTATVVPEPSPCVKPSAPYSIFHAVSFEALAVQVRFADVEVTAAASKLAGARHEGAGTKTASKQKSVDCGVGHVEI